MSTDDRIDSNPRTDVIASGYKSDARPVSADTSDIRAGIEESRIELGATVDAIQDRLDPEYLSGQAKSILRDAGAQAKEIIREATRDAGEQARDIIRDAGEQARSVVHDATVGAAEEAMSDAARTARGAGETMLDTIRQNPIPSALVGIGLGWLLFGGQRGSNSERNGTSGRQYGWVDTGNQGGNGNQMWSGAYATGQASGNVGADNNENGGQLTDRMQDATGRVTSQVQESVTQVTDQAQMAANRIAGGLQDTLGNIQGSGQEFSRSTQQGFQRLLQQSPMVVGGLAAAAGLAIGLALPETDREDALLGEAREDFMEQVKDTARQTQQKVQQAAQDAFSSTQSAPDEAAKSQQVTS
jgi:vacuolar-type H+-ATPase subunit H